MDRITRTVRQGFFSRLTNSIVGVLIGILMIPGSVLLLSWNEYRTIHRTRGLAEAERDVSKVTEAFEIDPSLQDKLVHVSGTATTEERLTDADFGVSQVALRLERNVEMYQWVEHKEQRSRDKVGGGRETITTYTYDKKWKEGRVSSQEFQERSGHENPPLRYAPKSMTAERPTLGAFRLPSSLVESSMHDWKNAAVDPASLLAEMSESERQHFKTEGEALYYSSSLPTQSEPHIGDLRIRFRVIEPATVSVLAKQSKEELVQYKTSNGESVHLLKMGNVDAPAMFDSLKLENTMIALLCRSGGWILACVGFSLIVGPLQAISNIIPMFGSLVGTVRFFAAVLLGSIVTLVTVSLAWIAVRPLFGVALLALAGAGIYLLSRRSAGVIPSEKQTEPPVLTPL